MTKTREEKMVEEERLFSIINVCCKNILKIMANDDTVKYLATKKQRIDPSNYAEIITRCEKVLNPDQLTVVRKCKSAIDASVGIIVERYMSWGLVIGEREGYKLGVDSIESKSSACMGLYRAAFTYKPGNGFANYAPFWIRQVIQKSIDSRMISTLDNVAGEEDSRETMKDKIPGRRIFEPQVRCENHQISEVYQRLAQQLPPEQKAEVEDWWDNDSVPTPFVRKFAQQMHSEM